MRRIFTFDIKKAIELLFFADLWINLYAFSLSIFNRVFPSQIPLPYPNGIFLTDDVDPEPFEIPFYIITALLIILLIYLSNKKGIFERLYKRYLDTGKRQLYSFMFLVVLFIVRLGFPVIDQSTPTTRLFFLSYLAILVLSLILFNFLRLIKNEKTKNILRYSLIFIFISILTFEPRFPITWDNYSYFFGPILEVARGQTVYTQAPSQYSFLWILILGFFSKLGVDIAYLPTLMWLLYIAQYFICFYLIFKVSKSFLLSFLGLFSILTLNYFSINFLPISLINTNAMRWPQLIISAWLFYKFKNYRSFFFLFLISILSFLTIDAGIEILLAYGLTIILFYMRGLFNKKQLFKTIVNFLAAILILFLSIDAINFIINHQFILLNSMLNKVIQFSRGGFFMIPVPHFNFFWFIILFYVASLLCLFKTKTDSKNIQLIVYVANLSLFASLHYLGRSHINYLFDLSLFPLLNVFLLIGEYFKTKPINKYVFIAIFILFILIPAYNKQGYLTSIVEDKLTNLKSKNIFQPEMRSILLEKYPKEISFIKSQFPQKEIVLLSPDDTYLLYLTGKSNLIVGNPQVAIDTILEVRYSVEKVSKICPKKIVVDCRIFDDNCSNNLSLVYLNLAQSPIFKELEKKCKTSYQKTICSGQLCVAESK